MTEIELLNANRKEGAETVGSCEQSCYYGLRQDEFDELYKRHSVRQKSLREKMRDACTCSRHCALQFLYRHVPLINTLRRYRWRDYLAGDVIAGLSIGVMSVPQSLGYALIASVPAVVGLYTSFFPVLIYLLFSTSRHVSIGSMALTSFLLSTSVLKEMAAHTSLVNITNTSDPAQQQAFDDERILIASSISFLAGIILTVMGVCRLGFIVSYMSESFVSGFLASANLRILTDQVALILGYKPSSRYLVESVQLGEYLCFVYDICANLRNTVLLQLAISGLAIAALIGVKYGVNKKFKHKLKIPIPIDPILIIVITVISYYCRLDQTYQVVILKDIPSGFPAPILPSAQYMMNNVVNAFMVAIISFMLVAMLARIFSERIGYPIDNSQELIANGLACVGGAFFRSIAASTSPPRCYLMESAGGHTQLTHFFSSLVILVTMLWVGPLFYYLPRCVLGCIVVVAYVPLFYHYTMWLHYFRTDRYDFAIWMVSMVFTLILPVDSGLIIGVIFSLVVVNYRMHRPHASNLVEAQHASGSSVRDFVYVDEGIYEGYKLNSNSLKTSSKLSVRHGEAADENSVEGRDGAEGGRAELEGSRGEVEGGRGEVQGDISGVEGGRGEVDEGMSGVEGGKAGADVNGDVRGRLKENGAEVLDKNDQREYVVFRFESPLYFATLDVFKEKLYSNTLSLNDLINDVTICQQRRSDRERKLRSEGKGCCKRKRRLNSVEDKDNVEGLTSGQNQVPDTRGNGSQDDCIREALAHVTLSYILIDCGSMSFMDTGGARLLAHLHDEYARLGIHVLLCACSSAVRDRLARVESCRSLVLHALYPSVQDAVVAVRTHRVAPLNSHHHLHLV